MYETIDISKLIEFAMKYIENDRKQYDGVFDIIRNFISENDVVVNVRELYMPYDIYIDSEYCVKLAKMLADAISREPLFGPYVVLRSMVSDKHLIIKAYDRVVANIISLPEHRGIRTKDLVSYRIIDNIPTFGTSLVLLDLVNKLLDLTLVDEWESLMIKEASTREESWDTVEINGGFLDSEESDELIVSVFSFGGSAKTDPYVIIKAILIDFLKMPERMCVCTNVRKWQLITAIDINQETQYLLKMCADKGIKLSYGFNDPKIPIDLRLRKIIFYLDSSPVFELFNLASYNIVPYNISNGIRVGTNRVIMKFKLIDYWTISILLKRDAISMTQGKAIRERLKAEYMKLTADAYPKTVIGIYENYNLYLKRHFDTKKMYPYYP